MPRAAPVLTLILLLLEKPPVPCAWWSGLSVTLTRRPRPGITSSRCEPPTPPTGAYTGEPTRTGDDLIIIGVTLGGIVACMNAITIRYGARMQSDTTAIAAAAEIIVTRMKVLTSFAPASLDATGAAAAAAPPPPSAGVGEGGVGVGCVGVGGVGVGGEGATTEAFVWFAVVKKNQQCK